MKNDSIGGYFELELPQNEEYHPEAISLNSGKNCLQYILQCRKYDKIYIPYYTCDVVLRPIRMLGLRYEFYHIDYNFEIKDDIDLRANEALLYTNYYGIKSEYVKRLAEIYGNRLIVDNTQAFFAQPIAGIDTFYTCRKFFGVSDGAYLYTNVRRNEELPMSVSYQRVQHLIKRIDISPEGGFDDFHKSDEQLSEEDVRQMSKFTKRVMCSIDYQRVASIRRTNYNLINEHLHPFNKMQVALMQDDVPMVYPFMADDRRLRNFLISNKVYSAKYWPNVDGWCAEESTEYRLANYMVPLPIDQRYGEEEMQVIISLIIKYYDSKR